MAMLDLAAAASQVWLPMLVGTYTDTDSKGIYQYMSMSSNSFFWVTLAYRCVIFTSL